MKMNKNTLLIIFLFLACGVFAACSKPSAGGDPHAGMNHNTGNANATNASAPGHTNMDHSAMDHSKMESSPNADLASYDLQFIDTMIEHHQGAVDMAKLAGAKAGHEEIKTLAANIAQSQEAEIKQMRSWREQWFAGNAPAINMKLAGMADSMIGMDMKNLDSLAGNAYDLEFIRQMIPHHQGAVIMAKEALQKSQKQEIKALAKAIIDSQEAEIKQMKGWETAWTNDR